MSQSVWVGVELHERLVFQIPGLVDLAFVEAELEVVVIGAGGKIVVIVSEDVLGGEIGAEISVAHPEHGVADGFGSEIAVAVKHGAESFDACAHAV